MSHQIDEGFTDIFVLLRLSLPEWWAQEVSGLCVLEKDSIHRKGRSLNLRASFSDKAVTWPGIKDCQPLQFQLLCSDYQELEPCRS